MAEALIYTVGHSLHASGHFVHLLLSHAIARLVDVRSHPASKRAPQFGKAALAAALGARSIDYVFLGRALGGRPEGGVYDLPDGSLDVERRATASDFVAGVERLMGLAQGARTAILCAEEDPARCHRERLVARALRQRGAAVLHIRGDGRLEPGAATASGARQLGLFG